MLLGDPVATWVEGRLVKKGDPLEGGEAKERPRAYPDYDADGHRFVPPLGEEIADPIVGFYRVGYESGAEGVFILMTGRWSIDVQGAEGVAYGWEHQGVFRVRGSAGRCSAVVEKIIQPVGESPTVNTIRNIVRELETGELTAGNIDMTMQVVEPEFGIAYSHLSGGARVSLPVADRSLYIPGG